MKIIKTWRVGACLTVALVAAASGASGVAQGGSEDHGERDSVPAAVASASLCRSIGQVDHLVVRRVDEFPQNDIHFSFPVVTVVTEVTSVSDVAKVVCSLPRMPSGVMYCPADLGITIA